MATIGFDIEFFIANDKTGDIVPACGLIGGTKKEHTTLGEFEVHEDNVSLEVNSPVFTAPQQVYNWLHKIDRRINTWLKLEKKNFYVPERYYQEVISFPTQTLLAAGQQALEIGCDPDFCAYNDPVQAPRQIDTGKFEAGFRYVGGHIHLGYETHKQIPHKYVARLLDIVLVAYAGISSERAKTYGLGLFRPKPYGIEYRSLSTRALLSNWRAPYYAFKLAHLLETRPQEMAEFYSTIPPEVFMKLSKVSTIKERSVQELVSTIQDLVYNNALLQSEWDAIDIRGVEARIEEEEEEHAIRR